MAKFYLLSLTIILSIINVNLFSFLRISDVLILVLAMIYGLKFNFDNEIKLLLLLSIAVLIISNIFGYLSDRELIENNIAFIYKYAIPFIYLGVLNKLFYENKNLYWIEISILIASLIIIVNIIIQIDLNSEFFSRASMPFTDSTRGDPHLLSSLMVGIYIYMNIRYDNIFQRILILNITHKFIWYFSIILTGSKSFFLAFIYDIYVLIAKKNYISTFRFLVIIAGIIIIIFELFPDYFFKYSQNLDRMLQILNITTDESSMSRINNHFNALLQDSISGGYLFGVGFLYSSSTWWDGIFALFISHGGLFLIILFILLMSKLYKSFNNKNSIILLNIIFLSNVITEFIFTTRYMIIIISILFILYIRDVNDH